MEKGNKPHSEYKTAFLLSLTIEYLILIYLSKELSLSVSQSKNSISIPQNGIEKNLKKRTMSRSLMAQSMSLRKIRKVSEKECVCEKVKPIFSPEETLPPRIKSTSLTQSKLYLENQFHSKKLKINYRPRRKNCTLEALFKL